MSKQVQDYIGKLQRRIANQRAEIARLRSADRVEVVRCKDCKYCRTLKDGGSQCERLDGLLMTKPKDYCSYGERSENGKS